MAAVDEMAPSQKRGLVALLACYALFAGGMLAWLIIS
jgi:hypothetical protein